MQGPSYVLFQTVEVLWRSENMMYRIKDSGIPEYYHWLEFFPDKVSERVKGGSGLKLHENDVD